MAVEKVNDVRDALERLSEYMEAQISKNQEINFEALSLAGL
jgi:hypothetical protein